MTMGADLEPNALWGSNSDTPGRAWGCGAASPAPQPQALPGVSEFDPHKAFGSKSAPIVMEVFSDYQCPACKTLFTNTNRPLMDNYVSTGKVFLIHREFPITM